MDVLEVMVGKFIMNFLPLNEYVTSELMFIKSPEIGAVSSQNVISILFGEAL
jgi:hypothetical protein